MNAIEQATVEIKAALKRVPGVEIADLGDNLDPPSLVLGSPALVWEGLGGPNTAQWLVYVVVKADERALERLLPLVLLATQEIDAVTDAVVLRADPGAYRASNPQLPCYEIQIEVAL